MDNDKRLILDMTADGGFRQPARAPLSTRIVAIAVLVAVVAGAVAFAAFALWLALALIPIVAVAILVAVGTIRFQMWRARRRSFGSGRHVRPL
jgi:hypothetical protein